MNLDKKNTVYGPLLGYDDIDLPIYQDDSSKLPFDDSNKFPSDDSNKRPSDDKYIKIRSDEDKFVDSDYNGNGKKTKLDYNFWWFFSSISALIISVFTLTFKSKKNGKRR